MSANTTSRPRHRLRETARPALLPRSASVVAVTVGTVLVLSAEGDVDAPAEQPGPTAGSYPLQPVPMIDEEEDVVPGDRLTGADLAVLHAAPYATEHTGHCAA